MSLCVCSMVNSHWYYTSQRPSLWFRFSKLLAEQQRHLSPLPDGPPTWPRWRGFHMTLLRQFEQNRYRFRIRKDGFKLEAPNGDLLNRLWILIPQLKEVLYANPELRVEGVSFDFRTSGQKVFNSVFNLPPRQVKEWPRLIREQKKALDNEQLAQDLERQARRILGVDSILPSFPPVSDLEKIQLYNRIINQHGDAKKPLIRINSYLALHQHMLKLPLASLKNYVQVPNTPPTSPNPFGHTYNAWVVHNNTLNLLKEKLCLAFGITFDSTNLPRPCLAELDSAPLAACAQRIWDVLESLPKVKLLCDSVVLGKGGPTSQMYQTESSYPLYIPVDATEDDIHLALVGELPSKEQRKRRMAAIRKKSLAEKKAKGGKTPTRRKKRRRT